MSPFFSIIIPTYNSSEFIEMTIESVFKQNYQDYEIIVVDDGSTDETINILKKYTSSIEIIMQGNKGPGAARNKGIEIAQGIYVAMLDSDDVWFPWTLELYKKIIDDHNLPSFVVGNFIRFNNPCELINVAFPKFQAREYKDYYSTSHDRLLFGTCSVAIKRDVLLSIGGYTCFNMNAEDIDLWMRLGLSPGFVRIINPPVFAYRLKTDSLSWNNEKNYYGLCILINNERLGLYPGERKRQKDRHEILCSHIRAASINFILRDEYLKGWNLYRESFLWNLYIFRLRYLIALPTLLFFRSLAKLGRYGLGKIRHGHFRKK